jgi:hypothetical protein
MDLPFILSLAEVSCCGPRAGARGRHHFNAQNNGGFSENVAATNQEVASSSLRRGAPCRFARIGRARQDSVVGGSRHNDPEDCRARQFFSATSSYGYHNGSGSSAAAMLFTLPRGRRQVLEVLLHALSVGTWILPNGRCSQPVRPRRGDPDKGRPGLQQRRAFQSERRSGAGFRDLPDARRSRARHLRECDSALTGRRTLGRSSASTKTS